MSGLARSIGKAVLKKQMRAVERVTVVHNFESASTAVLLFDASEPGVAAAIKDLQSFLSGEGVSSRAFALNREKVVPQELLMQKDIHVIGRKDLSWYRKAKGEVSEIYRAQEPDLLIDLSRDFSLEMQFLVQPSPAAFKVGCYTEENNDFDLMIHLKEDQDITFFVEQIKHYIAIFENPNQN